VIDDGALIVKLVLVPEPDDGTLPVPVQPVHTYCIPDPPETGEDTEAVMLDPASNHPDEGVGLSYADDTVR
jgi:hypothetical protein